MNRYLVKIDFHNGTSAQEEFEAGNKLQAHRKAYKKYKGQYLASTILQIVQEDAETTGRKEGVTTKVFIREIEKGVLLYRDSRTGIAWAEDHRTGLCISAHPNIDESGSVEGMAARGWWRRDDRIEKSHGWIYNIDRLAYDVNDPVEKAVADACMCRACRERRTNDGGGDAHQLPGDRELPYECPKCHNTEHLPGAKFCMICGEAFPLSEQGKA